jgi:tRNA threonylcarbamoyladenosine biosynthesis protein TsaE
LSAQLTESPEATEAIGAALAETLAPGDVVLISGELGSGKTTFVRGACRALGVRERVVSPTFTIGRRYAGRVPVAHLDLYRLEGIAGEDPALLDDYLRCDTIAFVEWPAQAGGAAAALEDEGVGVAARVELRHAGGDRREISITTPVAPRTEPQ